ncbi:MAG TPA: aminodeoxychorismate/anthranilate synthase component II, partial [Bacteroidia bacterium]|nr:aminodeoxychorismate/anthranilate synthase component II [Bacteroidia bacterium]
MKRILVFDNYDSFTYNLVHLIEKISDAKIDVIRNDKLSLEDVAVYDKIILSPGPGIPEEAGLLIPLIQKYAATKSILGVCLGHQAIAEALGGKLAHLSIVFHGVATNVKQEKNSGFLFSGLPGSFKVGRYHSWVIDESELVPELRITARDEQGNIMAIQHETFDVSGVQFHPESIMTEYGE